MIAAQPNRRSGRAWMAVAFALAWAGANGGCKSPPPRPEILRIWPEPPAPARIYLRRIITGTSDVKRKKTAGEWLGLVAGRHRQNLQRPLGIAVDEAGTLYVTDQGLQGVHVIDLGTGKFRFFDKAGKDLFFVSPVGVAVWGNRLAVSDSQLKKVFVLNAKGDCVRTIDKPEGFARPTGLACDPASRELYVADTVAGDVCVFSESGTLVRRIGRVGAGPGEFNGPTHLFVTREGHLCVSDTLNSRVQIFGRDGAFISGFGRAGDATGHMFTPKGIGVDAGGHVYLADSMLATMQVFDRSGRFLLAFGERGSGPGAFEMPSGVAVRGRMIYVCDFYAGRVQIFEYIGDNDEPQTQPDR